MTQSDGMNRRVVLGGIGAVGAAGVLAACSSGGSTGSDPVVSEPTKPGGGSAKGGQVVAATSDIPVGGGKVLDEKMIVVTQPSAGEFMAFTSTCPHQGCTVGEVTADTIVCPCHGSEFSAKTGEVLMGPAMTGLTPIAIKVEGTDIVAET